MRPSLARTNTLLWWIACLLVVAVYLLSVPRLWQCEGADEVEYLGLAHSMVRGFGYTLYGQPYVLYPPLYPFILSLILGHGAGLWRLLYMVNAFCGAAGLIVGATWLRLCFGRAGRWAGWLALVSYFAWSFSTRFLLSEALFFVLSVSVLILAWRVLCEERYPGWVVALVGFGSLLCAMTRFGAVALTLAVCLSSFLKWMLTRSRAALSVLVAAAVLGGGFAVAWEIRAQHVAPQAGESYARWARTIMGVSSETAGMVARNAGEGAAVRKGWPGRALELGGRYGQYVASNVRSPSAAKPLALFLWLVFLTGLIAHLKQYPWSPIGWYTAISLLIISLTSWISSYMRYLYPLTPFLFLFLLMGARFWWKRLIGGANRPRRALLVLCGLAGLAWSATHWVDADLAAMEGRYMTVTAILSAVVYGGLIWVGIWPAPLQAVSLSGRMTRLGMTAIVILFACQTAVILAARYRLTEQNQTLRNRNLLGMADAGAWLRDNTDPQAVCISSLPRLTAFLTDRQNVSPGYTTAGGLDVGKAEYVVRIGRLNNIPAFVPEEEERLVTALAGAPVVPVFASGDAAVYRIAKP